MHARELFLAMHVRQKHWQFALWVFAFFTALSTLSTREHYFIDLLNGRPFCVCDRVWAPVLCGQLYAKFGGVDSALRQCGNAKESGPEHLLAKCSSGRETRIPSSLSPAECGPSTPRRTEQTLANCSRFNCASRTLSPFTTTVWPEYFKREVTWLKKYSFQVVQFSRATSLSEENAVEGTRHIAIGSCIAVFPTLPRYYSLWVLSTAAGRKERIGPRSVVGLFCPVTVVTDSDLRLVSTWPRPSTVGHPQRDESGTEPVSLWASYFRFLWGGTNARTEIEQRSEPGRAS